MIYILFKIRTKKELLLISGSFLLHKNYKNKDNIKKGIGIYVCRNLYNGVSAVKYGRLG